MWIMLPDCFISVVRKDCADGELLVRARRRVDLERLFGKAAPIQEGGGTDYQYRIAVPESHLTALIVRRLMSIDYSNFKNSVEDPRLHDAYLNVWGAMHRLAEPNQLDHPGRLQSQLF